MNFYELVQPISVISTKYSFRQDKRKKNCKGNKPYTSLFVEMYKTSRKYHRLVKGLSDMTDSDYLGNFNNNHNN